MSTQITSTEALAGLLLVLTIAECGGATVALQFETLATLPAARELGATPEGWRSSVMLRGLYLALSPEHRELVDGDSISFPTPLWQMMTGEIVSL